MGWGEGGHTAELRPAATREWEDGGRADESEQRVIPHRATLSKCTLGEEEGNTFQNPEVAPPQHWSH
jgi:hypothetical protein